MTFFTIKELEAKKPAEGVEIRIIPGERMTVVFFNIKPGAKIPEHSHPHEQIGTVLKGSIELTVGKEKRIVKPGDAYHIPPDIVHSGTCLESPSEVIEIFSPRRDDLMTG